MPNIPATYLTIIKKALFSLVVLLLTLGANRAASNLLKARVKELSYMSTLRMLVRNTLLIIGCAAILSIWLEFGHTLAVAGGIVGAGIAFASREIIGCFAGYLNIVTGSLFQIGDRIRIGDVKGDVLDISLFRTTIMEIGEWVKADQYTGRTVTIANSAVFSDPVFNYTQHWRYLWDEIMIPVTYASNWQQAAEMMLEHGKKCSSTFLTQAQAELRDMTEHYPALPDTPVEPMIFLTMTDNWIEIRLRYIVEAWQRRAVKTKLYQELLQCFEAEPAITVASATYDIVGFPPLKGDIEHGQ